MNSNRRRTAAWITLLLFCPAVLLAAPGKAVTEDDVVAILQLRCTICHGARVQEAELDLRTRASMLRGGKSGPALVPGEPDASHILQRIVAEEMPPHDRLVDASVKRLSPPEIERVRTWIASGAAPSQFDTAAARAREADRLRDKDRRFWAFRSLPRTVLVPEGTPSASAPERNPIDAFIRQELAPKGLAPAPEATRQVLIRRVSFDLTGLPPTPDEVEAFGHDERPDAYERLVERMLASRRYGERWGRYWLDLAGYADTEGKREQDVPRPHAFRYRDYVIRAYNSNKPFDRFVHEQVAGDELADYRAGEVTPEIYDNLVATGFLRMSPDPTWANITGFVPDRLDVIADAIDVLSSSLLGLAIKCARCHEHRFDPISQEDYYRLAASLKGAYDEHDWLKPNRAQVANVNRGPLGYRNLPFLPQEERAAWTKWYEGYQETVATLKERLEKTPDGDEKTAIQRQLGQLTKYPPPERPMIRALWDRGEPSPTFLLRRGDYRQPAHRVDAGVPLLFDRETPMPRSTSRTKQTSGRRLALAEWLTHPDHPLTARVHVNHIWKHHFRHGLVRSLGNFGRSGLAPSHPGLLDWLAREFVDSGWDVKKLHRLILTSHTYRQESRQAPQQEALDPENHLLSRFPMKRLEAEALRDSLLFVSDRLDDRPFGPADPVHVRRDGLVTPVGTERGWRRSIYVQQRRRLNASLLESFDLPQMNPNCLERKDSTVAPQALHLLNDATVRKLAVSLAERIRREVGDDGDRQIEKLYRVTLGRHPTDEERKLATRARTELIAAWQASTTDDAHSTSAELEALTDLSHVLINSAEFLYVD